MCQSVDSRNHFWTSLMVCSGIIFSFFADAFNILWLYYADVFASAIIGLLILKAAIELTREFHRKKDGDADISHFIKAYQERHKDMIIFKWLRAELHSQALTKKELEERFINDFCKEIPKILTLTEFGFRPESGNELYSYLEKFVRQKKLIEDNNKYWLIA